jgi:hypothetical protein
MRFETQGTPPRMTLRASKASEEQTLRQSFGLLKEGDSITLMRKDTPTDDNPGAFEVSYTAPIVPRKSKKKIGGDE